MLIHPRGKYICRRTAHTRNTRTGNVQQYIVGFNDDTLKLGGLLVVDERKASLRNAPSRTFMLLMSVIPAGL